MISSREIARRIAALEKKGLDVPLIGRKPQPLKVQRKRALDRILDRLVLMHGGHQIVIALAGAPRMRGNRLALRLALQIPLGRKGGPISKAEKHRIEDFLVGAIEQGRRMGRTGSSLPAPSRASRPSSPRRASTGS